MKKDLLFKIFRVFDALFFLLGFELLLLLIVVTPPGVFELSLDPTLTGVKLV